MPPSTLVNMLHRHCKIPTQSWKIDNFSLFTAGFSADVNSHFHLYSSCCRELVFWEVGPGLLSYCSVSSARLAPVSQPVLSSALCIRGLFRNEPLCMGIMWDIWASAYCSMAKVKACPPHRCLPSAIHHLRTQTAVKLTLQPLWTPSHQFGRTVFFL